jgi:hypothetical protein
VSWVPSRSRGRFRQLRAPCKRYDQRKAQTERRVASFNAGGRGAVTEGSRTGDQAVHGLWPRPWHGVLPRNGRKNGEKAGMLTGRTFVGARAR